MGLVLMKIHEFRNKLNWIVKIWGILQLKVTQFIEIFR